jgi:peptidoglycan hydrolase CwlO-like protein
MENLIILAQTKGAATVELLVFLLVAAIIGYFTAYFYYKSIYMKQIHALESEIDGLKKVLKNMENKVSDLEKSLSMKEEEIQELKKKKK